MKKAAAQKLNIDELEMVSGGSNNQLGDIEFIKALLNRTFKNDIYDGARTMHRVFSAAGVTVKGNLLVQQGNGLLGQLLAAGCGLVLRGIGGSDGDSAGRGRENPRRRDAEGSHDESSALCGPADRYVCSGN